MPSDRPDRRRVVVVGGGIVGSAVALGLADLGMPVTLIDQTGPGSGGLVAGAATAASFGSISAFGRHQAGDYELACTGMASWARWAKRLGGQDRVGYVRGGQLRWTVGAAAGEALTQRVRDAQQVGYPVHLIRSARPSSAGCCRGPGSDRSAPPAMPAKTPKPTRNRCWPPATPRSGRLGCGCCVGNRPASGSRGTTTAWRSRQAARCGIRR